MANGKTYVYKAPRRRIERVVSKVAHNMSNSATTTVLHTCEDAKTLVRMRVQGATRMSTTGPTSLEGNLKFEIAPQGTVVPPAPAVTESLDNDVPDEYLFEIYTQHRGDDVYPFEVDSKAMRKLKPGDAIKLRDITDDTGSDMGVACIVTMWFKE